MMLSQKMKKARTSAQAYSPPLTMAVLHFTSETHMIVKQQTILLPLYIYYYRPHTKYDRRYCLHSCVSVHMGYPLVSGTWSFPGGNPSPVQVLFGQVLSEVLSGGYLLVLSLVPSQVLSRECHKDKTKIHITKTRKHGYGKVSNNRTSPWDFS